MKKTIMALCCVAALAACKKEAGPAGPAGPQGPQGPAGNNGGTGIISGKVHQYDQYNVEYTTGLNTTTVSIDGTTVTAVTDASGSYSLTNLAAGIYDISYTKANAGLIKQQQIVVPGAGTLFLGADVYDKPTFTLTGGYVKDTVSFSNNYIRVNVTIAPANKSRGFMVVIGTSANVDLGNPATYEQTSLFTISANAPSYAFSFSYGSAITNNIPSGTAMYAKVYPVSSFNTGYYNYTLDKGIYTNYGTPLPTTFTLTMP